MFSFSRTGGFRVLQATTAFPSTIASPQDTPNSVRRGLISSRRARWPTAHSILGSHTLFSQLKLRHHLINPGGLWRRQYRPQNWFPVPETCRALRAERIGKCSMRAQKIDPTHCLTLYNTLHISPTIRRLHRGVLLRTFPRRSPPGDNTV